MKDVSYFFEITITVDCLTVFLLWIYSYFIQLFHGLDLLFLHFEVLGLSKFVDISSVLCNMFPSAYIPYAIMAVHASATIKNIQN